VLQQAARIPKINIYFSEIREASQRYVKQLSHKNFADVGAHEQSGGPKTVILPQFRHIWPFLAFFGTL